MGTKKPTEPPTKKPTEPPTKKPTKPPTEGPDEPDDSTPAVNYPTCDCWTAECHYCANLDCTVQHDLISSEHDIEVTSKLFWRKRNSVMLYDKEGNAIGSFEWSLAGILLTGCVNCQTPRAIRKIKPGSQKLWVFTMKESEKGLLVQIKMDGEVVWEQELIGECAERYSQ